MPRPHPQASAARWPPEPDPVREFTFSKAELDAYVQEELDRAVMDTRPGNVWAPDKYGRSTATEEQRDLRELRTQISRLDSFSGRHSKNWASAHALIQAITRLINPQFQRYRLTDGELVACFSRILTDDAQIWFNARFPATGPQHPAANNWILFVYDFLQEFTDPNMATEGPDALLGAARIRMHSFDNASLTAYDLEFKRHINLILTSVEMAQPLATGLPSPAWEREMFWHGLHPMLQDLLRSERVNLLTLDALRLRAYALCPKNAWAVVGAATVMVATMPGRAPTPNPRSALRTPILDSPAEHAQDPQLLCTHPRHRDRAYIQHTWHECSHNPINRNKPRSASYHLRQQELADATEYELQALELRERDELED